MKRQEKLSIFYKLRPLEVKKSLKSLLDSYLEMEFDGTRVLIIEDI